jgi:hypothetical protein
LILAGGETHRLLASLNASSSKTTGKLIARTAFHSAQLRGVMTKRVYGHGGRLVRREEKEERGGRTEKKGT